MSDGNPTELPTGAPERASIDGILDGRIGDQSALLLAFEQLNRSGAGEFRWELQGGRFSLLPVETGLPPGFDVDAQARFLAALRAVLAAAAPGSVETNLRSSMVYATQVAETLFVVRGNEFEPLSRVRARTADDRAAPPPAMAPGGLGRRQLLLLAPLLLALAALLAWHQGLFDRLLATRAEALQIDTGPFRELLHTAVARQWGNYRVELTRGPGYPRSPQELAEQKRVASSLEVAAACDVAGTGGELYLQLLDDGDHVLAETRCSLRPLLGEPPGAVLAELPGQRGAGRVRLSVRPGQVPR